MLGITTCLIPRVDTCPTSPFPWQGHSAPHAGAWGRWVCFCIMQMSFCIFQSFFYFFIFWQDEAEVFSLFFFFFPLPRCFSWLSFYLTGFSALKTQQGWGDYKDWRCSDTSLPTSNWFIKDITIHSWLRVRVSFELALKSKGIVPVCKYHRQNKSALPPRLPPRRRRSAAISFPFDWRK